MLRLLITYLCTWSTLPLALFHGLAKHDSHSITHSIVSIVDTLLGVALFFCFSIKGYLSMSIWMGPRQVLATPTIHKINFTFLRT